MNKILIDTSVIVDFLRRPDRKNTPLYKIANKHLYISIIVHAELYAGEKIWEEKAKRLALEKVLSDISILRLTTEISELAGRIKAYTNDITLADAIIAATAISKDLPLATLNIKDFEKIDGLKLFKHYTPIL